MGWLSRHNLAAVVSRPQAALGGTVSLRRSCIDRIGRPVPESRLPLDREDPWRLAHRAENSLQRWWGV